MDVRVKYTTRVGGANIVAGDYTAARGNALADAIAQAVLASGAGIDITKYPVESIAKVVESESGAVLFSSNGAIISDNVINFKPGNTALLAASIDNARNGTAGSRWGIIGGSAVRGEGATGNGRAGNAAAAAWFHRLADVLQSNGIPATWDSLTPSGGWRDQSGSYPSGKAFADYPEHDSRVSFTGAITGGTANALGGRSWRFNNAAGSLIYTPLNAYNKLTVFHHNNGFASNASISAGGKTGVINNNAAATGVISTPTINLDAPVTTAATISWVSGDAMFMSIIAENTLAPSITLVNLGVCGAAAAAFLETGTALSPRSVALRDAYDLDVMFICFTGNDISQATPLNSYKDNLRALADHWSRDGETDVFFVSGPPYAKSIVSKSVQDKYIAAFREIARELDLPLVDFWRNTVSREFRTLDSGYYADNIHAGPIGQIRWSQMFQGVLL